MLFEKASRLKLLFNAGKGLVSTEDLWDLSLKELNAIAKTLNKELKETAEEDFLGEKSKEDTLTKLRFDIVLHILNTKKDEKKNREEAQERKAERERILSIIERKDNESLENMSKEDLLKKLDELG